MTYVAWFKQLSKDSLAQAGGKGANLGEMFNLGLPVPDGFVITAQAYQYCIETTHIKERIQQVLSGIDYENNEILQKASVDIQQIFREIKIPIQIASEIVEGYEQLGMDLDKDAETMLTSRDVFVAVRSSATAEDLPEASFAGQQATFLNIRKAQLLQAVLDCWASLFTARAIYYRERNGFDHMQVFIAVVVQRMVNSDESGVMFTVNPATNHKDEIVVEAVFGLGETIVSGAVSPDLFIFNKEDLALKKKEVRRKEWGLFRDGQGRNIKRLLPEAQQHAQVISDRVAYDVARYGKLIEKHYGKPMDIEWAVEHEKVFIVQARAVTTLNQKETSSEEKQIAPEVAPKSEETKILVKGETASPGIASGPVKIVHDIDELSKITKGDVLVTSMTTPDMVPAMQRAAAIVTDEGGITCHASIVSREMGIPCIVGTDNATKILKDDQTVTVHATRGIVYEGAIKDEHAAAHEASIAMLAASAPTVTATEVKVVMDLPQFAAKAAATGADGVGLARLEIIIANGGIHPAEFIREGKSVEYTKLIADGIREIAHAFHGKPVWVRNSDIRTDEYRNIKGGDKEPHETDPMIGWHAIRRLLDEPEILKAEFKAIKQLHEEGLTNVGIMLPFVIRTNEVRAAKQILREVGLEPQQDVEFGVMIETPASCWIIEELCEEGIDFVSFGTNDLTQLTLGIDRNNQRIAKRFEEMHPAVLGQVAKVIATCQEYGVKTSICGQAGSRSEMAEFLVQCGIDSISAAPDAVEQIRRVVARAEQKLLLTHVRKELNTHQHGHGCCKSH